MFLYTDVAFTVQLLVYNLLIQVMFLDTDVAATVKTSSACDFCGQSKSLERVACCGKWLCEDCEQIASTCPFCHKLRKIITGNQPPGYMKVALIDDYADGYENIDVWKIKYYFPEGTQKVSKDYNLFLKHVTIL